ncbi:hypothetical protein AGMMS50239_03570 [Bacteroidia bacterium]|nr:hypothetical protein AGMMS50239_03570 [Bacteroidia bacterium]
MKRKITFLSICLIVSFLSTSLFSQEKIIAYPQSGEWVSYDGKEMISKILKDGKNLWIAANSGLLQLDTETESVTFHDLGISDLPRLRNLVKDKEGNLWITTQRSGVVKYDGQRLLEHYDKSNFSLATDQYCTSIAIDASNNIWISSLSYLNRFDGNAWQAWTTPRGAVANNWFISDLKFERNGDLWMSGDSPEWRLARFTGQEIQPVPEITQAVSRILIDQDNNKWLASLQGLIKYDGTHCVTWNTENSGLPANDIYDIKQDASGNLWLACNKYLVRFDGHEFTSYTNPLLLEKNERDFILCLELDERDNIWLGTKLSGLFKFIPAQRSFLRISQSPTSIETVSGENENFLIRSTDSKVSVNFLLTAAGKVSLSVFDLQGKEAASLLKDRYLSSGNYQYSVHLTTGVYLIRYIVDNKIITRKILVK